MKGMDSPLDNPFTSLLDSSEQGPDWAWKATGTVAGVAGAAGVRWLLEQGRERVSRRGDVPLNPADERMGWLDAIAWAAFIAIGGAFGRLLTQRALAGAWQRRTNRPVKAMPSS